jgi:peptidoglycan/LPS O-acetylase OafA/YrhL
MQIRETSPTQIELTASGIREPSERRGYRRDIDGLRAIAVTSVVAYHVGLLLFRGGYVGVDIFFVISGYLIGAHVYKDVRHGRFNIATFYQRRAKRILPALLTVLLFCYAMAMLILDSSEMKTFAQYAVATLTSLSNILAWLKAGYFGPGADQNPLLMTWSLGVEEQFYLIFPLFMLCFGLMGRRKLFYFSATVALVSFALSMIGVLMRPTDTFYLLPTRAWELSVGVLLAIYETDRPVERLYGHGRFANITGWLGLAFLLFPVVMYSSSTPFPGLAAALPVLGSAFILISPSGWVNRIIFASRPLSVLGTISYSWYLWHWPLLSFARTAADHPISKMAAVCIGLASLGIAWCSYRFVEQPFRKSITPPIPLLKKYGLLCLLMALPAAGIILIKGWPQRFPRLAAIERHSGLQHDDPCLMEYGVATPNLSPHCVPNADPREGVALLGDSHAGALADALREMATNDKLKFYEITKTSCAPLLGVTRLMPSHPMHARECSEFNATAFRRVENDPRIRTVILSAYWSAPFTEEVSGARYQLAGGRPATHEESVENLKHGLSDAVEILHASGKRVIVLEDVPLFRFDPVRRLRWTEIPVRGFLARLLTPDTEAVGSVPRSELLSKDDDLATAIVQQAASPTASMFDPKSNLCDAQACSFLADGRLLYVDSQHLSTSGALLARRGLALNTMQAPRSP